MNSNLKSVNAETEITTIGKKAAKLDDSFRKNAIWKLDTQTPGQRNSLRWNFDLPNGTTSYSSENKILLSSFQEVAWQLFLNSDNVDILKAASCSSFSVGIRELFRWMVHHGYKNFSELTTEVQRSYLADIPALLSSRYKFYLNAKSQYYGDIEDEFEDDFSPSENVPQNVSDDDKLSYSQVFCRVKILFHIFAQKEALSLSGLPSMPTAPFSGKPINEVASEIAKYTITRIPPLPDEVALPLLKAAFQWVDLKSKDVITLQEKYLREDYNATNRKLSRSGAVKRTNSVIKEFAFSCMPQESISWRKPIESREHITDHTGKQLNFTPAQILRSYVLRARDACVIILQYFVGLRIGEICSILGIWDAGRPLPNCIDIRYSKNGLLEMFFLKAVLSKGVPAPVDEEWLLGCRPVGSNEYPAPVRAIVTLVQLLAPWREMSASSDLLVCFSQKRALPRSSASISKITSSELLRGTKRFVFYEVDLSHLPDSNENNENLALYRDTKGRCIRTHQGRKTFAAYVLESRSSLLRAVSDHFKHYDVAMTEAAYYPAITRLRGDAESIRISESVAFFTEAIYGKPVHGKMGEVIQEYFSSSDWKNLSTQGEIERKVTSLVKTHDLRVFFTSYGACLIKADPLKSRCREASGGTAWDADTPYYEARSAGLCAGCGCFAMDSTHLPFWENRVAIFEPIVESAKSSSSEREFRVHKARLAQAQKVVKYFLSRSEK